MAATSITTVKVGLNGSATYPTLAAVDDTAQKAEVSMGADQKMLILVQNSHASAAKTVTVKAGDGIQGTADMTAISIAAGATICLVLESGKYASKGKVTLLGESTDIKVGAIQLP